MKVYVYSTTYNKNNQHCDLMVPNKDDFSSVPEATLEKLGTLSFRKELELTEDAKLIALDSGEAIRAIKSHGYYLAGWAVSFKVS